MKPSTKQLMKDERGAAMAEALILAIFFVFVGTWIMHMHTMYSAKLKTYSEVRGCAWAYANGGCKVLPPECKGAATKDGLSPVGLEAWAGNGEGQEFFKNNSDLKNTMSDALGFASKAMDALNIVGKQTTVTKKSDTVTRSSLIGSGDFNPGASYAVFCNEPKQEAETMAEQVFCRVAPRIPGC